MIDFRMVFLAIASGIVSCHPSAVGPSTVQIDTSAVMPIPPPWTLDVADGNGNLYHCEHTADGAPSFEYRPVKPKDSSSGVYSGGKPRRGTLSAAQVRAVWEKVEAAARDTAGHGERREMGTVAIDAHGPIKARVILRAAAGAELLALLTGLPRPAESR